MKKILLIFFVIFFINLVNALKIENLPESVQLIYGEKNFTFVLNPENQNVSNIRANCITPFECSVKCPISLQSNSPEICNVTLRVKQYTYAGMYEGLINVSGETWMGEVNANKTFIIFIEPYPNLVIDFNVDDIKPNDFKEFFVNIKNNGNVDLKINASGYVKKDENVYDRIIISLNETDFYLAPNQTKVVKANLTSREAKIGKYYAVIKANAKNESWNVDVNYTKEDSFNVVFTYCDANSNHSYLAIEITNKDRIEGKKFYPYDNVELKIKVRNDDEDEHYVIVEAALVKDDVIEDTEVSKRIRIDEDDYVTLNLTIQIPLLEEDVYYVYVKAYDDDNEMECIEDNTYINVTRPSRGIRLIKVTLDKDHYACGDSMLVSGGVVNIGEEDQELVKISYKDDLQNSIETKFGLDIDEERNFMFNVKIPENATEGIHEFLIYVYYNYNENSNTFDDYIVSTYTFNITGNCIKPEKNGDVIINLPDVMYLNESSKGAIIVKNTGSLATIYQLAIIADWAQINLESSLVKLEPGEEKSISIDLIPLKTGTYTITAKIAFDGKEKTAIKEIEVKEYGKEEYKKASWIDELVFEFERRPWLFAIMILCTLISIVCIILLVIILSRKK
jgi:hypothetical protein